MLIDYTDKNIAFTNSYIGISSSDNNKNELKNIVRKFKNYSKEFIFYIIATSAKAGVDKATVLYKNDIDNLQDLDLWVVGLLRNDPHPSHAGFEQILDYIKYIKPKKTIFTHMTALLDEEKLISKCPKNVLPAFDGMEIEI